jgi:hypothetical protein
VTWGLFVAQSNVRVACPPRALSHEKAAPCTPPRCRIGPLTPSPSHMARSIPCDVQHASRKR